MKTIATLLAILASAGITSAAESDKIGAKAGPDIATLAKSNPSPIPASLTYGNYVYYTSVTVPGNSTVYLDSTVDFSASGGASISVLSNNLDIANLSIAPYWSSNGVPYFMPSTSVSGANFSFLDSGSAYFPVAGSQLRLFLTNRSTFSISLKAVVIYASAQ